MVSNTTTMAGITTIATIMLAMNMKVSSSPISA